MDKSKWEILHERLTSTKFIRNIIVDGRMYDEELISGWELSQEEIDQIVMQSALEIRKKMQDLRKLLFYLQDENITLAERRDQYVNVICLLHEILEWREIEEAELEDIRYRASFYDAGSIRITLRPLYPECEDYVLMYHARQVLDSVHSAILFSKYLKEKKEGQNAGN